MWAILSVVLQYFCSSAVTACMLSHLGLQLEPLACESVEDIVQILALFHSISSCSIITFVWMAQFCGFVGLWLCM